jgi:predicted MPP superfamily phosphohydrolase
LVFTNARGQEIRPNLALAGHTHGGQVTVFGRYFWVSSEYGYRYLKGWKKEEGVPIFISNGLGSSVAPLRLGSPAHFEVITFRTATQR